MSIRSRTSNFCSSCTKVIQSNGARLMSRELRVEPAWAVARLKDFCRGGIVREESPDVYRYAPKNERLRQVVQAAANAYSERRVAVIDFIYSKPLANLRVFAESFRIRDKQSDKDDKDG